MGKRVVMLYLSAEPYEELKRVCRLLGVSVSSKVDELIIRGLKELTGREFNVEERSYEELKCAYKRMLREVERLKRSLQKRGVYESLVALTDEVAEDLQTEDASKIIPEILRRWDGDREDAHLFISLLEAANKRVEVERKLEEIRLGV